MERERDRDRKERQRELRLVCEPGITTTTTKKTKNKKLAGKAIKYFLLAVDEKKFLGGAARRVGGGISLLMGGGRAEWNGPHHRGEREWPALPDLLPGRLEQQWRPGQGSERAKPVQFLCLPALASTLS